MSDRAGLVLEEMLAAHTAGHVLSGLSAQLSCDGNGYEVQPFPHDTDP